MNDIEIAGMLPLSTIDYPGHLAAVIFTQGCQYKCNYCHNTVLQNMKTGNFSVDAIMEFLDTRINLLDGVVITGGEPLIHTGLATLIERIKLKGFRIGLHTSGAFPTHLYHIAPACDWVGLDYKAPMYGYPKITGCGPSGDMTQLAIQALIDSHTEFEVRTTWHPDILSYADLCVMAEELLEWEIHDWTIQLFQNVPNLNLPPFGLNTGFVHEMFKIGMNVKVR